MKHLHFEAIGGASGDMILAALVDLGVELSRVEDRLHALPIAGLSIEKEHATVGGVRGTRIRIRTSAAAAGARHLPGIRQMIRGADSWSLAVRQTALAVFERLAEVEARIHGVEKERIHFHEIGALDSIADICGCLLGVESLAVFRVSVGPLPLGRGIVRCAHGILPNPAPATLELLRGHPVEYVPEEYETVTPTGAALLMTLKNAEAPPSPAAVLRVGYGMGTHEGGCRPDILRAVLLETAGAGSEEYCLLLETAVDDTTPELLGVTIGRLLEAGALDAYALPIVMKKQRPAAEMRVICQPGLREKMLEILFTETTTLGVRQSFLRRSVLHRSLQEVSTEFGRIRVKVAYFQGQPVTVTPEMEDCRLRARDHNVAVRKVFEAAQSAARRKIEEDAGCREAD